MKKADRILDHAEFVSLAKSGSHRNGKSTSIHYKTRLNGRARVGITVSKKNGNAVTRNKIKRQIRSIIDKNLNLDFPIDLIVLARYSYNTDDFQQIQEELVAHLRAIGANNIEKIY